MELSKKRWLVIAAGVLANLCQGAAYSFSVFKEPLKSILGCTEPQVALAFSLSMAFLPVGMVGAGLLCERKGPRFVVALGGITFSVGMFLAGFTSSLPWLYLTFGVMLSLGNGMAYGTVIATAVKWFPDRRGMASGTVVGALGIGTLVIAPVAQRLIANPAFGVLGAFKLLGAAFLLVMLVSSRFIVNPPKDYYVSPATGPNESCDDQTWRQMLTRPRFWLLFITYTAGAFSGLMVISQAKSVASEVTHLTDTLGALVVSALGLANASGRVFWGAISDRIGRMQAVALMFAITCVVMFSFLKLAAAPAGLFAAALLVGLCYGGYLGTFPSICADAFGSRNMTLNYGILFSAFALAGILGPIVGASLRRSTGGYAQGFIVAGAIAAFGIALSTAIRFAEQRRPRK